MEAPVGLRLDRPGGAGVVAVDAFDRRYCPARIVGSCFLQTGAHRLSRQPIHVL